MNPTIVMGGEATQAGRYVLPQSGRRRHELSHRVRDSVPAFGWQRCPPLPEPSVDAERRPQPVGNRHGCVARICPHFVCRAGTDQYGGHTRRTQRELDCRRSEWHPEAGTRSRHLASLSQQLGRRLGVIERVVGERVGKQAAVENPAEHRLHTSLRAQLQERRPRPIEQAPAPRQQHTVERQVGDEPLQHLPLVHAAADLADHALVAQLEQRGEGLVARDGLVMVGVVHVHDVDAVDL